MFVVSALLSCRPPGEEPQAHGDGVPAATEPVEVEGPGPELGEKVPGNGAPAPGASTATTGDTGLLLGSTADTAAPPPEPCGPLVWARAIEGSNTSVEDLVPLPDGGLAAAGEFSGTVTFGAGDPNETTLTSTLGWPNVWVGTFDLDGSLRWVTAGTGGDIIVVNDLAVATDGSLALAGWRSSVATFGSFFLEHEGTLLDGYLAKFDPLGNVVFATSMVSDTNDSIEAIAVGPGGEIYAGGAWGHGDLTFPNGIVVTNDGAETIPGQDEDGWVAKWSADGTFAWAHHLSGDEAEIPTAIAATETEVGFLGRYSGELVIPGGSTFTNNGVLATFLVQFATDGTWMWDRTDGGPSGSEYPKDLWAYQGAWAAGGKSAAGEFGVGEAGETIFVGPISYYGTTFDRATGLVDAAHELVATFGGISWAAGALDADGRWAAGGWTSQVTLGPGTNREILVAPLVPNDPVVATFEPDGTFRCTWLFEGNSLDALAEEVQGVAFDGQGGLWVGGEFDTDLRIAAGSPEEVSFTSTGDRNAFLARFLLAAPPALVDTGHTADTGP